MLSIQQLNQFYDQSHILWDVDLTIPKGLCTCLMGRNGVGKTTLLQCIMGLLKVRSGKMEFKDQPLLKQPTEARARLGIAYVPQGRDIFPQLTVEENLSIALHARRSATRKTQKKPTQIIPERVFELFPVLKSMLTRRGGDLSGGQQQQLAIGRALVLEPELLILDEPCEGIQPNIVRHIGDVIQRLNKEEALTVLVVEQKLGFARRVADRFTVLEKGRCVADGAIDDLSDHIVQRYLTV